MRKSLVFATLAGLVLASCSNEEFVGGPANSLQTDEIGFSTNVPNMTRANVSGSDAARKLNNNMVVYGFKYFGTTEPTSETDVADATKQQTVFNRFNVNYIGNAGTTLTNAKGWEYVGYNNIQGGLQTMKYWDYSATGYVFSAIAGVGVTLEKIATGTTVYDKGWTVTIPAGGSLSSLYVSNRVPVKKTEGADHVNKYPKTVDLTFYSLVSKLRFGIYETVPGYTVHIDKCYCIKDGTSSPKVWDNRTTNFGVTGIFYSPKADKPLDLTVTYYDAGSDIENRPKVEYKQADATKETYKYFGSNMMAATKIGETSAEATYDQAGGEYTYILPYQSLKETETANQKNDLKLYIDFTLTAENGGETIKVKHASVVVPTQYTQWKENFAYTYLFKISNNANGTTGKPKNEEDPEDSWEASDSRDPEGLYAITFDACVVTEEDGVQETVTTLGEIAINTYQQGVVVTANDEYVSGDDIYFTATQMNGLMNLSSAAKVYEVYNLASAGPITEGIVANFETNKVVLVPVTVSAALQVPMKDGSKLDFAANNCYKFTPKVGKTYAIQVNYNTDKYAYKVVKVAGAAAGAAAVPSFLLTTTTKKIQEGVDSALCVLTCDGTGVEGALKNLKVVNAAGEDVTDKFTVAEHKDKGGKYIFKLTDNAISAGADGTYTVKFAEDKASSDFSVDLNYVLRYTDKDSQITNNTIGEITKGDSAQFRISIYSTNIEYIKAVIESENSGIVVKETAKVGTYQVNVSDTVTYKPKGYKVKVAGLELIVKVKSYYFMPWDKESKMIWGEGLPAPRDTIYLYYNDQERDGTVGVTITSSNPDVVEGGVTVKSPASGMLVSTAKKGGEAILSVYHVKRPVTVKQYELTANKNTIKRATESTKLTMWCNGEQLNATTATVKVKKYDDKSKKYDIEVTTGFSLTADGSDLTFGNVTATGKYQIEYYHVTKALRLGYEQIEVTD